MMADEINDLRTGMKYGVWLLAIWKDGKQFCGIQRMPLKKMYAEIDSGKYDADLRPTKK